MTEAYREQLGLRLHEPGYESKPANVSFPLPKSRLTLQGGIQGMGLSQPLIDEDSAWNTSAFQESSCTITEDVKEVPATSARGGSCSSNSHSNSVGDDKGEMRAHDHSRRTSSHSVSDCCPAGEATGLEQQQQQQQQQQQRGHALRGQADSELAGSQKQRCTCPGESESQRDTEGDDAATTSTIATAQKQQQRAREERLRQKQRRKRMKDLPPAQQERLRCMNRLAARRHRIAMRRRDFKQTRELSQQERDTQTLKRELQTLSKRRHLLYNTLSQLHSSGRLAAGLAAAAALRRKQAPQATAERVEQRAQHQQPQHPELPTTASAMTMPSTAAVPPMSTPYAAEGLLLPQAQPQQQHPMFLMSHAAYPASMPQPPSTPYVQPPPMFYYYPMTSVGWS